ncbi:MAG: iron ABC transporter permease [Actinobacteria bacterium]|nr:iron ABC transporter permease [Actinomycetota bacterium]
MVVAVVSAALLAAILASLAVGAVSIPPSAVLGILLDHAGFHTGLDFTTQQDAVMWGIRLPRIMLGALVGAGLGVAGASYQAIFRNPLADPQLIGVSSGAALGSALTILVLGGVLGTMAGPLGGLAGGLAAGAIVYALARHEGRTEVVTLILAGIAVAAVGTAGAGFVSLVADEPRLKSELFWVLGSMTFATWRLVWFTLPFVAVAVVALPVFGRAMNVSLLGDSEARSLGIDVERFRVIVLVLATMAVGASVAAAGVIGFVGLLVPHGVRLAAGPDNRLVVPASAIGGAALVVLVDLAARTVASPTEIPVGLLTAVLGGPVFLWLVRRTRREHGGWG